MSRTVSDDVRVKPLRLELQKPEALDQAAWAAVVDQLNRLQRAVDVDDRPAVVGAAKELVECTARVVLASRGQTAGDTEAYDRVLGDAHRLLEHQPGPDLTMNASVRAIANGVKKLAMHLRGLRNEVGTGHGRTAVPQIEDEVIEVCVDAAMIWARWALRRLQQLLVGSPAAILTELRESTFPTGKLTSRLQAANLPGLDPVDQRMIGVAVGQRASEGTFNVRIEGVEACARDHNEAAWPAAYREGLVEGLFLNRAGQVQIDDDILAPRLAVEVIAAQTDAASVLRQLDAKLAHASWSPRFSLGWPRITAAMELAVKVLPAPEAQRAWKEIIQRLTEAGNIYAPSA